MSKKNFYSIIAIVFVALLSLVSLQINQGGHAYAATSAKTPLASQCAHIVGSNSSPRWIIEGSKYVRTSGESTAVIDPKIKQDKCIDASELAAIKNAVGHYNLLPTSVRGKKINISLSNRLANVSPNVRCPGQFHSYTQYQWWGYQMFMNECDTVQLEYDQGAVAAIATFIAGVCAFGLPVTAPCVALGGAIAAGIAANIAIIVSTDHSCGNIGVSLNVPWSFVPWWFHGLC